MVVIGSIKKCQAFTADVYRTIFINKRLAFNNRLRAKAKVVFGVYLLFFYRPGGILKD
jgi:hypothetical protein